jgi:hypothetical protein
MKTEKTEGQAFHLKKSNNRWKWMAGATAATAAGVSASQATAITINLTNNYIDPFGNHLNADLTGDGHPDLTIANAAYFLYLRYPGIYSGARGSARVDLNGVHAHVYFTNATITERWMYLGSRYGHGYNVSYGTRSLVGSIPIFFKDLHINGGAPTRGSLEVRVDFGIQLDSFTYNTPNTPVAGASRAVPEQGSSLALLAMGAGGILALRRWRTAQGRLLNT